MKGINWRKNLEEVREEISGGTRLPMFFFYRKDCTGSRKTLDEIFTKREVQNLVEKETAPIMVDVSENEELARKYHVDWTPGFVITDEDGNELERWVGYLPEEELSTQLILSKGLAALHLGRYTEAESEFDIIINEHPTSELVPEAEYFNGIARFKEKGDEYELGEACRNLNNRYPDSIWTRRTDVWEHMAPESRRPFVGYDGGGGPGTY